MVYLWLWNEDKSRFRPRCRTEAGDVLEFQASFGGVVRFGATVESRDGGRGRDARPMWPH